MEVPAKIRAEKVEIALEGQARSVTRGKYAETLSSSLLHFVCIRFAGVNSFLSFSGERLALHDYEQKCETPGVYHNASIGPYRSGWCEGPSPER